MGTNPAKARAKPRVACNPCEQPGAPVQATTRNSGSSARVINPGKSGALSTPSSIWYLYADPVTAPVYVYGYLNGAEGPQVTTGPVSGVDGVEVSVIFDFGVGAIDWRGGYFNPGI